MMIILVAHRHTKVVAISVTAYWVRNGKDECNSLVTDTMFECNLFAATGYARNYLYPFRCACASGGSRLRQLMLLAACIDAQPFSQQ